MALEESEDLTQRIKNYPKFQPGDWKENPVAGKPGYCGPIYDISLPSGCNDVQEIFTWESLGYKVDNVRGGIDSRGEFQTLKVRGDIPDFFKARLEEAGIRITLVKPRNKEYQ